MRIVIAEDSVLFREGLIRVLRERRHEVLASAGDVESLRRQVRALRPDLAIVDIRMPAGESSGTEAGGHSTDGACAAVDIRRDHPGIGVLLLSGHIELRHCVGLIGEGGFGYLLKDRVLNLVEFDEAVRRVAGGGSALDPEIVRALVRSRSAPTALSMLTDREREVLALVAQGLSNATIAARLHLSERTVEAHMRSIFTRLDLHDDPATHRRVRAVLTYLDSRLGVPNGPGSSGRPAD